MDPMDEVAKMIVGRNAGEEVYLHEDGSVHKVRILKNTSDDERVSYKIQVLEAIKPTHYRAQHVVGKIFDISISLDTSFICWEFRNKPYMDA